MPQQLFRSHDITHQVFRVTSGQRGRGRFQMQVANLARASIDFIVRSGVSIAASHHGIGLPARSTNA